MELDKKHSGVNGQEHCECHENGGNHEHEHCHCGCHGRHGHHHGEHAHGHEHSHEHHHEEEGGRMTKIVISAVLLIAAWLIERNTSGETWQYLLIYLIPYLVVGWDTLKEAAEGIAHGDALSEDFLMSVATLGALAIGFIPGAESQFPEAVFVMLFFQLGEWFEEKAEGSSRRSIAHLMNIRPDVAHVVRDEKTFNVKPQEVKIGEVIVISPGEKIPLDGEVLEGSSQLDTLALTGESVPRNVRPGDSVLSGCVNGGGVLKVKTTREFGESTASKILSLVEEAAEKKSSSEKFITRFARVYTPVVVGLAAVVALVPSIITGEWATWLYRGLLFLVVSCPCALVLSIPLTFFGGIGGASRKGILIKGSDIFDTLAGVKTAVFDKTGTLTEGVFEVTGVHPVNLEKEELLKYAAAAESHSSHPVALALRKACAEDIGPYIITGEEEIAGHGIKAVVNGKTVAAGNEKLMRLLGITPAPGMDGGTVVHVAINGAYAGQILISDRIKEDAKEAVSELKGLGVERCVMLTGDRESVAAHVASKTGVDEFYSDMLPEDKVQKVESLLPGGTLAFAGDGINDAPVLTRANIGFAMGAMGSDAAIEAADVVIMDDKPSKIAAAVKIARKTILIANENIVFAIGIKVLVLLLALFGLASMGLAVFADVGVTVLAVLNATRALGSKSAK